MTTMTPAGYPAPAPTRSGSGSAGLAGPAAVPVLDLDAAFIGTPGPALVDLVFDIDIDAFDVDTEMLPAAAAAPLVPDVDHHVMYTGRATVAPPPPPPQRKASPVATRGRGAKKQKRRPKVMVPDAEKTAAYYIKRDKGNEATRRSRLKAKMIEQLLAAAAAAPAMAF